MRSWRISSASTVSLAPMERQRLRALLRDLARLPQDVRDRLGLPCEVDGRLYVPTRSLESWRTWMV